MDAVFFSCPKCGLLCEGDPRSDKKGTHCRHCGTMAPLPKQSKLPPQYEVECVDFRYDLSHLCERLAAGWGSVRDLASPLGLSVFYLHSEFANPTHALDERVADALFEVLACGDDTTSTHFVNLSSLVLASPAEILKGESARRLPERHLSAQERLEVFRRLAELLSQAQAVQDVLPQIFAPPVLKPAEKYLAACSFGRKGHITALQRSEFAFIAAGAASHDACDEAWWRCVAAETEQIAQGLKRIQEKVRNQRPIGDEEHSELNEYLAEARPVLVWVFDEDGSGQCVVKVEPDFAMINRYPMQQMATALIVQPVYSVARELEDWASETGPRFIVTCRNPHCGQTFYSGHQDAVACPKKPGKRITSPCKREWDKFARWLRAEGRDVEVDWKRKALRKQYLSRPDLRNP